MVTYPVKVYLVNIDTKEMVAEYEYGASLSYDGPGFGRYGIDYESFIAENNVHGIFAINNGYVHSSYEYLDGAYITTYEASDNVYFGDEVMDSWILYVSHENPQETDEKHYRDAVISEDAVEARLKFGGSPYDTVAIVEADDENEVQFLSISITEGLMSDSFFSFGSTYSPNCDVTMTKCDYAVPGVWFRVEYKIDGVWQCFGVFKINSVPAKTSDEISFSGVGMIESILEMTSYTKLMGKASELKGITFTYTSVPIIIDFEEKLKDNADIWDELYIPALISREYETDEDGREVNISTTAEYSLGENFREIWSNFAVAFCANVVERNGVIHIVHVDNDAPKAGMRFMFNGTQYTQEPSDMGYYYYPSPINVNTNLLGTIERVVPATGYTYVSDIAYSGSSVEYNMINAEENVDGNTVVKYPLTISNERLYYYTTYMPNLMSPADYHTWGYRQLARKIGFLSSVPIYKPISIELMGYHPCIFPGSRIAVDNGNIVDYMGLVGNVTITYDGTLSMAIDTPCEVQIEGANGSSSGGSGASSASGIASFTSFVMGVQDASVIKDKAITGSKIADSTITSTQIADSTITGSKIADSTITNTQIKDSTITGSKIVDGTLDGSTKIENATITYAKMASSFISDLTAETAYINNLKSNVANITTLTASDAIIQNIFSNSIIGNSAILDTLQSNIIDADYIRTVVIDVGALTADEADIRYANIALSNIAVADVGRFYADSGILTDVLIQDGSVTGVLNGVRINADVITTGTLAVDRLLVTGEDSIVYQINVDSSGLSEQELSDEKYQKYLNGTDIVANSITASQIAANTIKASNLNVTDIFSNQAVINKIFAQDVTATGTISGATLDGVTITSENGTIGGWEIGSSSLYSESVKTEVISSVEVKTTSRISLKNMTTDLTDNLILINYDIERSDGSTASSTPMYIKANGESGFANVSAGFFHATAAATRTGLNDGNGIGISIGDVNSDKKLVLELNNDLIQAVVTDYENSGAGMVKEGTLRINPFGGNVEIGNSSYTNKLLGSTQIGANPIYANNGTAYGMQWGTKNSIVGATSSTTANRTGLIVGQVGSATSSYGALVFAASSYIYAKGSLVLNTSGSVTSSDNRAVSGKTIYDYINGTPSNTSYRDMKTSSVSNVSMATGTTVKNLTSLQLEAGLWVIHGYASWQENTSGRRELWISDTASGYSISPFAYSAIYPYALNYGGTSWIHIITFVRITATTTYYLNGRQVSGSPLTYEGGIEALRIGF